VQRALSLVGILVWFRILIWLAPVADHWSGSLPSGKTSAKKLLSGHYCRQLAYTRSYQQTAPLVSSH
jgi:hypothetical protein